jgi:hypothetical protein
MKGAAGRGGASRGRGSSSSSRGGSNRGRGGAMIDFTSVQMDYESVTSNNNSKIANNMVSQYPPSSTPSTSTYRRQQRPSHHVQTTGIGSSQRANPMTPSRFMPSYSSDSDSKPIDLLKPVTFVKASSRLASTFNTTDSVDDENSGNRTIPGGLIYLSESNQVFLLILSVYL